MSTHMVQVRELVGWRLDDYEYRDEIATREKHKQASRLVAQRTPYEPSNALVATSDSVLDELLAAEASRPDLRDEMTGLSWSLGVVDLRSLLAFQRRLSFRFAVSQPPVPADGDWRALVALSFGLPQQVECDIAYDRTSKTLLVTSRNPNLYIRTTNDAVSPIKIQSSGPFFEVACFRGRWFLRDGYHRAYALLRAGVFEVPAVIVQTSSLEELGAVHSWFFPEERLFSETPPRVVDFLDDKLVVEYKRPALIKTLRIAMEETLAPESLKGERQ